MGEEVREYQRNAGFVAFILTVCFAAVVYTTRSLRDVLVPLVWSGFFAVPLTALVARINNWSVKFCAWLQGFLRGDSKKQPGLEPVAFTAPTGSSRVQLEGGASAVALVERLRLRGPEGERPRGWCCGWGNTAAAAQCCRCRVRITKLVAGGAPAHGPEVNRLVESWSYYVTEVEPAEAAGASRASLGAVTLQLELFLDQEGHYPAVVGGAQSPQAPASPRAQGEADYLSGTLELDGTSAISWAFAVLAALAVTMAGVFIFIACITVGVKAIEENAGAYQEGIKDFVQWANTTAQHIMPDSAWDHMGQQAPEIAESALKSLVSALMANFEYLGWQALLFMIYLLFWIFEPLPVNSSVAQVFKSYLLLKSVVCLIFAALMSALLRFLHCPLWHLFFVTTFMLNYIPEIGAIASAMIMLPAVLFDGNLSLQQRQANTVWLVIFGTLFKVITGNVLEVRMYATMGGQHMRMHPVVMMALMMLCEALLGVTGMFLAIPIMAAVKYYMVSTEMPGVFLNPLLALLEGDQAGPHKNFVDRHVANYGSAMESSDVEAAKGPAAK